MEKQELIQYLQNLDDVSYDNGKVIDNFHLGQILSHYIENELGLRAYQEFNILLNDTLTLKGCNSLLPLYEEGTFDQYFLLSSKIKEQCKESIIINEFRSLVELIEIQLNKVVTNKQHKLDNYIESLIKEVIQEDQELSNMIDHEKATIFIQSKVSNILNLEAKTAYELNQLDLYKANKKILLKQITNTLIEYCQTI
jgi:hypothetical protein